MLSLVAHCMSQTLSVSKNRMRTIEFEAKVNATSVKDFVESILIENSKFNIERYNANLYTVRVKPGFQSLLLQPGGFANTFAKGVITEAVIDNPSPEIEVRPTIFYYGFQLLISVFYLFVLITCIMQSEFEFLLFFSPIAFIMIGFVYAIMRIGQEIFVGEFIEEQKTK